MKLQTPTLVHDIPVDSIIESNYFQMRADGIKRDVVVRYAGIMKDNDPDGWMMFPEILLMKDIGSLDYYLIGGFHRLGAMKENGYETINALCFDGDRQAGLIAAANENSDRSQRRTHEDIKHVCRTLIQSFPDWGFGQLAKWGGVDRNTMERHYKEMQDEGVAPDRPDALRYITRHGTEATRKPTRTLQIKGDASQPLRPVAEEEGPDLQGLREEIYDLLDAGDQIYAPELAHTYSTPLAQVELIIEQAKADVETENTEKRKTVLMDEYEDLSSEGWSIWNSHLKSFITWEDLFAKAQSNWLALENSDDYKHQDNSEESLKLQITIWKSLNDDLEYATNVIKGKPPERGNMWLLRSLAIDVESDKPIFEQVDFSDEQKRNWLMEEVEASYADIESEIVDLSESEQVEVRQSLKVNYHAYPTYEWRDKLKLEALKTLGETLDQIYRDIKEKGIQAFGLPEPPMQPTPLQIEPLGESNDDMTLPEPADIANDPIYIKGEPDSKDDETIRTFEQLDLNEQLGVRYAKSYSYRLSEIEGIPAEICTLAAQLHQALDVYTPDTEEGN